MRSTIHHFTARSMHLQSVGEAYAREHGLIWRSIGCDHVARRVTIYGPRYEVLHVIEGVA